MKLKEVFATINRMQADGVSEISSPPAEPTTRTGFAFNV